MAKLICNAANITSTFILGEHLLPGHPSINCSNNVIINGQVNFPNTAIFIGVKEIEINNNHELIIPDATSLLRELIVNLGKVSFDNNYPGQESTNIFLGEGAECNLTGLPLNINNLELSLGANFSFKYNATKYNINNEDETSKEILKIQNPYKLVDTAKDLELIFQFSNDPKLAFYNITAFKQYEQNKDAVKLLIEQNNFSVNTVLINKHIAENFPALTGIAKSWNGIYFEMLPVEITTLICSYLNISDVSDIYNDLAGQVTASAD